MARRILPSELKSWPVLLATGFGSGLAPKAPGTFGTLAALPFFLLFSTQSAWFAFWIAITAVFGVWLCGKAADELGVHDHGGIVWDEWGGMWLTLLFVPLSWTTLILGFLLFRLFDIVKPWPIGWADKRVSGGLGIMLDDVIAGVFANVCLQVFIRFT